MNKRVRRTALAVAISLFVLPGLWAAAPIVQPAGPIELSAMEVRESDQGSELRVEADGPLIWTQYRDEQGRLVVELPNTRPAAAVGSLSPNGGIISGIDLVAEGDGERPLTRLLIATREDAEHSLFVDDRLLTLLFVPAGGAPAQSTLTQVAESEEPSAPVTEAPAPVETSDPESVEVARTIEPAPEPVPTRTAAPSRTTGASATRLLGIESVGPGALRVLGDGEFVYSTFRLDNPPRFVIDLEGVVNTSPRSSVDLSGEQASRVRMAQFEPYPNPVTRVVIDLSTDRDPLLEPRADGLAIRFSSSADAQGPQEPSLVTVSESSAAAEELVAESLEDEPALDELPVEAFEADAPVPQAESTVAEVSALQESQVEDLPQVDEPAPPEELTSLAAESEQIAAQDPVANPAESNVFEEDLTASPSTAESAVESALPEADEVAQLEVEEASPFSDDAPALEPVEIVLADSAGADAPVQETADADLDQPLFIENTERRERPTLIEGGEDVTIYEAQEPNPAATRGQTGSERPIFGVQTVDNTRVWVGEPVTMSLKDAEITEVLRTIARVADLNLVIQPGVSGPVTVELVAVPWDQALDQILKVNGLGMQLEGNILRIAPSTQLQQEARDALLLAQARALSVPLVTILKRLSYARAQDVSRILTRAQRSGGQGGLGAGFGFANETGILSQRGSVSVDNRTNTLIIQELPDYLDTVIQVIENLDTPERQVMIEARIVEATRNFSRTLGIQWGVNGESSARLGNTTGLQFPNNISGNGGVQLLRGGQNGSLNLSLGNILNSFQLDVALQAAETEGLINIISAPKVATLNNERATVQSGLQIPIQTVANNTVSVQFINATLRLGVQPQVTAEGTIIMDIDIQKREPLLAFAVAGATNAPINTRDAQTRVIVRDGGTAVIAGIYTISSNEGTDRVPGLANVPVLGHLFKNRARDTTNEELLIFITPRVIQL